MLRLVRAEARAVDVVNDKCDGKVGAIDALGDSTDVIGGCFVWHSRGDVEECEEVGKDGANGNSGVECIDDEDCGVLRLVLCKVIE